MNNWGTAMGSKNIGQSVSVGAPFVIGNAPTTDIIPPNTGVLTGSIYGYHNTGGNASGVFDNGSGSYIDTTFNQITGKTYYFAVVI